MSRAVLALYALSVVAHLGLAISLSSIRKTEKRAVTAITMAESPKPKKPDPKPPVPPKAAEPKAQPERPSQRSAKAAPVTPKPGAPPPAQPSHQAPAGGDALPDFGLSMTGGGTTGGLALPGAGAAAGDPLPAASARATPPPQQKRPEDCDETLVKPKPQSMPQGAYNDRAREARVEGKVRIELQVDDRGKVTSARLLGGLGHGLDESAVAAAKQWTFAPASRCGKPVSAPFVIGMRFVIGS